jgi:hypothetical protein
MDKGTQGKRFGTIGCWTEDWETANVGGAGLFETLQSRVKRILRFSDIAEDDDSAYNTDRDSGA